MGGANPRDNGPAGSRLPAHVAIIMDGNGRWASARGLPRPEGHRAGARTVRDITRCCREIGIPYLTLYAFSTENWGRPSAEVEALQSLLAEYLTAEREEILSNGIRLVSIGQTDRLFPPARRRLEELQQESAQNQGMTLSLALSYGGRQEILSAVREIAARVQAGELAPETEEGLAAFLQTGRHRVPDVDLMIRTGGNHRISNFLLWQIAYAEIAFTDTLWPDFDREELGRFLDDYAGVQRRYGLTPEQAEDRDGGDASSAGDGNR